MAMPNETSLDRMRRLGLGIWIALGTIALVWVVLRIADSVRIIWLPLIFGAGLVFLLNPIVSALQRFRIPRVVGTFFAFTVLAGILVSAGFLIVPLVRQQATDFATQLPDLYGTVVIWLEDIGERFGFQIGPQLTVDSIAAWIQDPANQSTIQEVIGSFGSGAGHLLRGVTEGLAVLVLAPLLGLYILIDLPRTKRLATDLTPPGHREEAVFVARQVATALGSFVRGQLLVAFIVGLASSISLYYLDIPFWAIIGILSGLLNLVPFAGPVFGGALAALVALLDGSVTKAILAVVIFTAIQQVDNHVITPMVQRTRVQLSPLVIVLALIVGGALAGLLGVLVAVPLTAAIRIIAGHLWRTRMLGQSWAEASEQMIEFTPPPERIAGLRRRQPVGQQRLFDTAEHAGIPAAVAAASPAEAPPPAPGPTVKED